MPFTFNEGQTDKILLHPSGNMDSAVLALNHFFAFVFSSCYAGDLSNKANTISPGQLRDFCFHPDDLNWLVYLCLSDPLIARIRFVHTAPVPNNIKKGEIYAVLEKSSDLRNFATAHWAWFHRDYLSWTHLENIRPNENSMNCSTVMKSIDFYCDIEYQILIKATVDYIDSKGQTHPGRRLRGTSMSPLTQ